MLSKLSEEFDERNCKLLAIGVDSKMGHRNFIKEVQVGVVKQLNPVTKKTHHGDRVVALHISDLRRPVRSLCVLCRMHPFIHLSTSTPAW